MIPPTLIRTVPQHTSLEQETVWDEARALHPDWEHVTFRDPIDPNEFPRTAPHWHRCTNGAQLAGLVRLEALWQRGGIYLDSDVAVHRPLDALLQVQAFAAWEDRSIVPDAVLGAVPGHPAIDACLDLAIARITGTSGEPRSWQTDTGAWSTGPGVTTTVLVGRADVLLLGPESFYPVHYAPRETLGERLVAEEAAPAPWTFGTHRWNWSWQ